MLLHVFMILSVDNNCWQWRVSWHQSITWDGPYKIHTSQDIDSQAIRSWVIPHTTQPSVEGYGHGGWQGYCLCVWELHLLFTN